MINMLRPYYRINQCAGININLRNDGGIEISCCSVAANGNQLNITEKQVSLHSVNDLDKHLPDKTIVGLNLSGKGILHKQLPKIAAISQGNFNQVLPNGNITDFYVQQFDSGEYSFISVIRKADADKWISQLTEKGYQLLALSLGPFAVGQIVSQLNFYENELIFDGNIIRRNGSGDWTEYKHQETPKAIYPLKVDSEKLDEKLLIPYAAAFQLIIGEPVTAEGTVLNHKLTTHLERLKTKMNGAIILTALFVLLLFNFLAFSWLNGENTRLATQVSRFARNNTDAHELGEQIRKKEQLLQEIGWEGGTSKSRLVDQVASLMPEEITLKEIAINPIDLNSSRTQKRLTFSSKKIRITGTCENIIPVNEWIARINTRPWAHNIKLESYTYSSELQTGQFTLTFNY